MNQSLRLALVATLMLATAACSTTRPLMPTPHLYSEGIATLFGDLAPELKTSTIPLFFVTDRAPEKDDEGALRYGFERSASIAYGDATVEIQGAESWEELAAASTSRERDKHYTIELMKVREIGRTPPTPFPYIQRGGFYEYEPAVMAELDKVGAKFHAELNQRLALTPRKEVLLFVHGYNNDFRDAALTWASMWHFFGREGVPVLYSWPAGRGGLSGYAYDRESGEFTVQHLKMLFRALAKNPKVEGIRVLSHSRGTDVLASTLRELFIESRAAGVDPNDRYRIRQLILAAPDLDFDVTMQRIISEPLAPGVGYSTVYVSQSDKAIGIAEWLFSSAKRIGRLQLGDLISAHSRGVGRVLENNKDENSAIVELKGDGGEFGHSYFHENPAVSSDVLQVLRFDRRPGAENGRPLKREQGNFWLIEDDYLLPGS
jgi:esterase/lipase superfamily enzyme